MARIRVPGHSAWRLGVPALRPGCVTDNPYDAAARRDPHEGSPLPDPWLSARGWLWLTAPGGRVGGT